MVAGLAEEADGLFGGALVAADGVRLTYYLLHAPAYGCGIVGGDGVSDAQVAVVAVRYGNVYHHAAVGIEVVHGLAEHEEERAGIGTLARGRCQIEEFHIFIMVYAEAETLHLVVHLGADRTVGHIEAEFIKYFRKCTPDAEVFNFFSIFAPNLY